MLVISNRSRAILKLLARLLPELYCTRSNYYYLSSSVQITPEEFKNATLGLGLPSSRSSNRWTEFENADLVFKYGRKTFSALNFSKAIVSEFSLVSSRRSVSWGWEEAARKTAREKVKERAAKGSERTPVGKLRGRFL